ncbi:uncharacterized protein LOC131154876 isoform X2 [Malania oleifera]|uniref:uncharacterized protein LOC131154876 isoform X2 n=1 Tax=Malania oleifera TaxID=397392 RepID=UPI0025ADC810|nr:uncharacterized protein LOC131154876 isoform X2 [Malania oleifera]
MLDNCSMGTVCDNDALGQRGNVKRVVLSLIKPSYTLGLGLKKVRPENRGRLCYLLSRLVGQHNWTEASGVLSLLLKGTCKDNSPMQNRMKYRVTMELLKHIEGSEIKPTKIKHIYEIWMRKIGSMKNWPVKDRFAVQLEFIIFCLTEGNVGEAHQAALCLMQECDFGNDPIGNMVLGLTFYQLWYSNIPEEMQLRNSEESCTPMHLNMSGTGYSDPAEISEGCDAVGFHEADPPRQCDSDSSVMNNKEISMGPDVNWPRVVSVNVDVNLNREEPHQTAHMQDFYANSAENSEHEMASSDHGDNMVYASMFSGCGKWDPWLVPLRFPHSIENFEDFINLHRGMLTDNYRSAVKYFRLALYSTNPVLAALLPLVQLLLVAGQVKEALNELERFCCNSSIALPLRLRAGILEHSDHNNCTMLSTCYEDILKKDPTCSDSLGRLVSMHRNGVYSPDSLLEMISLHLEATFAEYNTWREFASCFLKLSQCEEDRMSTCLNGNGCGLGQSCIDFFKKVFVEGQSGKTWRLRCIWWMKRHFSKVMLASEIAAGNLELLAYKAACASHIYGPEFGYVVEAGACLGKADGDLLLFLQKHIHNAIALVES